MLELHGITKDYPAGSGVVQALKGIDLAFRSSEFVAVLGPSGCGKTTMLNIIGGLDQYTRGDLVINGISTKNYKDRDWDGYRNHSVGFVFQSYNLIPHQSVLQNVELALTLSGVSKSERRKRAKKALEDVGLAEQINKKPNEMSGGQMQRVAIARAIVNDPDIILADEPTGALDSETSLQVMDILKEISKNRLVVMVTHNPDLAEKYATRVVRMLDGLITSDSDPLSEDEIKAEYEKAGAQSASKTKKPSMSFFTSFGLSLKNLFTKKGRTALTGFAGSIGIIGIALIYAVSQGTTNYINAVQEDTLSSYPLMLESKHVDLGSLIESFIDTAASKERHDTDKVYEKTALYDMVNAMSGIDEHDNDLGAFKKYLEAEMKKDGDDKEKAKLASAVSGVQYTYARDMIVYTKNVDGNIIRSNVSELMRSLLLKNMGSGTASSYQSGQSGSSQSGGSGMNFASMMRSSGASSGIWQEMLSGKDGSLVSPIIKNQYDLVYGSWPASYDQILIVLDKNNEISDMTLYALGLKSEEDMGEIIRAAFNKEEIKKDPLSWTYEEICAAEYRTVLPADCYVKDAVTGNFTDLRKTDTGEKYLYDNALALKVVGIIKPNETTSSKMLTGSIVYTKALTERLIETTAVSESVKAQLSEPGTDIFTGFPFRNNGNLTSADKKELLAEYISDLSDERKAEIYIKIKSIPDSADVDAYVEKTTASMTREAIEKMMLSSISTQTGMNEDEIKEYVAAMSDDDIKAYFKAYAAKAYEMQYAAGVMRNMATMDRKQLAASLDAEVPSFTEEQSAKYYEAVLEFSDSSYEDNLEKLGVADIDSPSGIYLYAATFESKDTIKSAINDYNSAADEMDRIEYTDYVGLIMSSVTTIINAITYVLIAFVAVSLVVSSIMIGVITLISVQERTKEIGILRAIGASKKNVSSLFNAETLIIGFLSGAIGVGITYLLCIPINAILHLLTGISTLSATLPVVTAVTLVLISMALTLISGIIPSRSAAKKDPVVALRTE